MSMLVRWEKLRERLPGERTLEQAQQRMELFKAFDPNGNGYLSLAEVDRGVRVIIGLDRFFGGAFDCKPVITRAFHTVKKRSDKRGESSRGPDCVEASEFRIILLYLRQYFALWEMWDEIDSSPERPVTIDEFTFAVPLMEERGITAVDDPKAAFAELDAGGGGVVPFDDFAAWAIERFLDLEDADD